MLYESAVASAVLCYASRLKVADNNRLNKQIHTSSNTEGEKLDSDELQRALILQTFSSHTSMFSERLTPPVTKYKYYNFILEALFVPHIRSVCLTA